MTRPRRYPSDLTDAQWAVLEPVLPVPLYRVLVRETQDRTGPVLQFGSAWRWFTNEGEGRQA